ncbi:hypothetical protein EIK77_010286 [Talaromyces pinophilus]|nr:hypothetical protein EIK77_010286 [Talaromyces pinophilus]
MDPRPTKKRLSMACNSCRLRKVKCDADYPRCRNCRVRDEVCATSDPRRPGEPVVREWIVTEKSNKSDTNRPTVYASPTPSLQQQSFQQAQVSEIRTEHSVALGAQNDQIPSAKSDHSGHTNIHESPVHQPFHVSSNTDPELNRTKIVGGSSSQCLAKSLDVYLKSVHRKPVSDLFKYGMKYAEEFDIPLEVSLPPLPDSSRLHGCLSTFFDRIHPLYPLFNVESFHVLVNQIVEMRGGLKTMPRDQIPWLAIVYLAVSIGADEQARGISSEGTLYLQAASSLIGHVTSVPYLPAVQAMLMFTIAYRGRNQEGLGWQYLGMAIRIAHTTGLHRRAAHSAPRTGDVRHVQKYTHEGRIWAICCILEKCMELESGRPTAIPYSFTCDDILPPHLHEQDDEQLLRWQLGLAVYQNQISQHIYGHTLRKRRAREILLDTARLDKCLLDWVNGIPPQMRPGNDIFCPRGVFHFAASLSIMYHESMITLHRAALIAPNASFEAEVEKEGPDDTSRFRILGGESICINSARAIAKLSIELSDQKTDTRLIPAGVPLLACIVLAIYLIKHPDSRMQSTDLQVRIKDYDYYVYFGFPNQQPSILNDTDNTLHNPNKRYHPDDGTVLDTRTVQPYEDIATDGASLPQYNHTDEITNNKQNQVPLDVDRYDWQQEPVQEDNQFPFDGYNVEDLWEWMLYFDSQSEVISHAHT